MQRNENDVEGIGIVAELSLNSDITVDEHVGETHAPESSEQVDDAVSHRAGEQSSVARLVRTDEVPIDAGEEDVRLREETADVNRVVTKFTHERRAVERVNREAVVQNGREKADVQLKGVRER